MSAQATMPSSPPTIEQWFEKPHVRMLSSSEGLGWDNIAVNSARLIPGKDYAPSPHVEDYHLIMVLEGSTRMNVRAKSHPRVDIRVSPGDLEFVPPFVQGDSIWDAPITAAFVQFPCRFVTSLAGEMYRGDPERLCMPPIFKFSDPLLRTLIDALCNELYQANPLGTLYVESLTRTIIFHLLTHYSNVMGVPTASASRGRLTTLQIRLLDDYIQAHLDQKINLDDLAMLLFMSVPHFERLFRKSLGCAPYRYVLERRIERAKGQLANANFSLHEVARQSGFANQSHFTKHFTRFVGCSPARYRESFKA